MSTGTYVGIKLTKDSQEKLSAFAKSQNVIPVGTLEREGYHLTLLYSRKECPELIVDPDKIYTAIVIGYTIFNTETPDPTLVIKLVCMDLVNRHNQFRMEHGATHDYPLFIPHVTLSYSFHGDLATLQIPDFQIELTGEYKEVLDLDWKE